MTGGREAAVPSTFPVCHKRMYSSVVGKRKLQKVEGVARGVLAVFPTIFILVKESR
jgi:hypothetical protein